MVSYCSLEYLVLFLPVIVLLYGVLPKKFRPYFLILSGYFFFWTISSYLLICLIFSTLSIHHIGLWLNSIQNERNTVLKNPGEETKKQIKNRFMKKQRAVICFGVILHIGILAFFKYTGFFTENVNSLLEILKVPFEFDIPKYAAPIGISFYTLQAVSYMFDVYREKIQVDKNIFRLALYMSFFPQIVEGPICRYSDTADQLWKCDNIKYANMISGLQRIAFGIMKKIVIADRLNLLIKKVFTDSGKFDGGIVLLAAICYTCQLYMEFSGTMDIVIGSAEIFNVKIPENFNQPFFSKTISEFWKRWHITLGTFFRDYVFYPLAMSKPLKKLTSNARKKIGNHYGPLIASSIALFCVWLANGIWHGAGWRFIFFGMYHFVLILGGNIIEPLVIKLTAKAHINRSCKPYVAFQIIRTSFLVVIGEMFFRAEGLSFGIKMFKQIFTNFTLASFANGKVLKLGMDRYDFIITGITVLFILFISIAKEKGISIRGKISEKNVAVRFIIYYAFILFVIIFGAYGTGYIPIDPIYANF